MGARLPVPNTSKRGPRLALIVVALLAAALVPVTIPALPSGAAAAVPTAVVNHPGRSACPASPFPPGLGAFLAQRWPGHPFTASVHDTRTGCDYSFQPDVRITTASVLKAEILAGILLRAQEQGRGLTATEQDLIFPMITQSANGPADQLWSELGGVAGMQAVDRAFGLSQTSEASPWGLTSTSAADRTRLLRQLILGEYGPLDARSRAIARSYMLAVIPSQRWGVTAGVPPTWAVPLKNGFYPSTCCGWRVNSSGVIERPDHSAYVLTILSDGWPDEPSGIDAVQTISRVVAASLAGAVNPFPSASAFVDRQYADVLNRKPSFADWYVATQAAGTAPASVADALLRSPEYDHRGAEVIRLYLTALGRLPDPATYRWRAWQLATHQLTAAGLAGTLMSSPEFSASPLSDAAFAARVAPRRLGHSPEPATVTAWIALLGAGVSRAALLDGFADSTSVRLADGAEVEVAAAHLTLLGRLPSPSALAQWEARLRAGRSLTGLVTGILRSSEYRHRVT